MHGGGNMKPLSRSWFQKSTDKIHGSKSAVGHRCSVLPGTIDYGSCQGDLPGLQDIGRTSKPHATEIQRDSEGRFLFPAAEVAIDHMLFSIILFHKGEHADHTRARFLDVIFEQSANQNYVCVTKINAKKKELERGPLFCLVRAGGGKVYIVLPDPTKPLTTFQYTYCYKQIISS
jgi:hypothetical protein